ncbi:MAG TPA: FG-GAP repeat protein, partial [Spirochaetota bacterium]|nr:FG-GAP repeat protein [Spirochaetota bacterium]
WSHQAYLKAPNNTDNDQFGFSVAIYGDTIAVGAPYEDSDTTAIIHGSDLSGTNDSGNANGAVYVFTLSGGTWTHQAYLKAPNNGGAGVGNGDNIGSSVAIYGGTIAVGASNEASTTTDIIHGSNPSGTNDSGSQNGAVYVFTRQ